MNTEYDVTAIGNALVDVIAAADDTFLARQDMAKGAMMLIDEPHAEALYGAMAPGVETSGGSAANTIAGVASFGGRAAFIGKVAADPLGDVFGHDLRALGADFSTSRLTGGPATGRCLINVTPDGERTMSTYLGAGVELTAHDVSAALVESSRILYLEGYLFDPHEARRAFAKAAGLAHGAGRSIALTLSDGFVVERHRAALLGFIDTQVDILFANETEICALFETDDFDAATTAIAGRCAVAAVTRGELGSVILADGERLAIPAYPIEKLIDTTGAGDQYAAGFLYGLAGGRSLDNCGRLGSLAAAEVIGHYGPRPAVSLRDLAAANGL
jgi:sugar/nucleoside kinase (ribokinase family)